MRASTSSVAASPSFCPRAQISPTSRPTFSGLLTPTPTNSNRGFLTISAITILPTNPVPQTTTRFLSESFTGFTIGGLAITGDQVRESPDLLSEFLDLRSGRRFVGSVLLGDALHNPGGQGRGHGADQSDATDHQRDGDHASHRGHWSEVSVANGGDRGDGPPHRVTETSDLGARLVALGLQDGQRPGVDQHHGAANRVGDNLAADRICPTARCKTSITTARLSRRDRDGGQRPFRST